MTFRQKTRISRGFEGYGRVGSWGGEAEVGGKLTRTTNRNLKYASKSRLVSLAALGAQHDERQDQEAQDPGERAQVADVHIGLKYRPASRQDGAQRGGGQRQRQAQRDVSKDNKWVNTDMPC